MEKLDFTSAAIGSAVSGLAVLTKSEIRKTRSNPPRPYAYLTFSDGNTTISGSLWNYTNPEGPKPGIYELHANIGEYNGTKQLNNIDYKWCEDQDMSSFSATYVDSIPLAGLVNQITDDVAHMEHEGLKAYCTELVLEDMNRFMTATSARGVHHFGVGGNIAHSLEVASLARQIALMLKALGYNNINAELCYAGGLLHDIGKLDTYVMNGPAAEMTVDGILYDHIVLGINRIVRSNTYHLYPSTGNLLMHIISSHHGDKEKGSPSVPAFMEAHIVSHADGISSTMGIIKDANEKAAAENKPGEFTDRIFYCGNVTHMKQSVVASILANEFNKHKFSTI